MEKFVLNAVGIDTGQPRISDFSLILCSAESREIRTSSGDYPGGLIHMSLFEDIITR